MALPTEPKSPEEVLSLANKKDTEDLVQVAGVFDKSLQKIITDATKETFGKAVEKIAPKTVERLGKAAEFKAKKEAEIEAADKAVLDEITYGVGQDVTAQVDEAVQAPQTIASQINSLEDLEGYLTKNAGINIAKPESVSLDETAQKSVDAFSNEMEIPSVVLAQNGILNSAQVTKAFEMMRSLQEQNVKLAELVSNPDTRTDALELQLREGLMKEASVRKYFMGARSEVGRTLNIFKNLKKLVNDDPSLLTSETIQREFGGAGPDIANGYLNAFNTSNGNLARTSMFAEGAWWQRAWAGVMHHYYFNMLANPKTQLINMIGNASFGAMSIPEYYVAGLFTSLNRQVAKLPALVGGKKLSESLLKQMEGSINRTEAQARFMGLMHSIPYAFRLGVHSFKTGQRSTSHSQIGDDTTMTLMDKVFSKNRVPERTNEFDAFTGDKLIPSPLKDKPGMNILGKFLDYYGAITSVPGRGLLSADEFFKETARQMELFSLAERARVEALLAGKTAAEAESIFVEVLANPGNNLKNRLDQAADYFTFQNSLDFVGQNLKAVQSLPGGRLIVPFFNVIYNISKVIFGYVPGPNLIPLAVEEYKFFANALQGAYPETVAKWTGMKKEFERDPTKRTLWEARVATSIALLVGSYHLLENGHLIGPAPKDPENRAAFYDAGKVPFSFTFKKGNWEGPKFDENGLPRGELIYRRFIGFEPIAGILGTHIAAIENMARFQAQDPDGHFAQFIPMALVAASYDYATEWPIIKGFATLLETFMGPWHSRMSDDPENIKFEQLLSGISTNMIGGGTVGQHIGNLIDPTLRVNQPAFEQDLEIFLGDIVDRKLNPDFGQYDDSTVYNQFTAVINKTYAAYDTGNAPARKDIFAKEYSKDSGRGWIGNVRNSFLPFSVFDREKPSDLYLELLRLHEVTKDLPGAGASNKLMRPKKHSLMGVIGLNEIQTAFYFDLVANNNKELVMHGILMPLERRLELLTKSPNYRKPKISPAFIEWTDGTLAGFKQYGQEDLYRLHLITTEINKYKTAATAAYIRYDRQNDGPIFNALKEYKLKTNWEQPDEFDDLFMLKR